MKKYVNHLSIFFLVVFSLICFSGCSFREYLKKAILGTIPIVRSFQQHSFKTYTSITGIKDKMQLVTAKQQLDFINIMEGKDGRYIEVSTFEVKAGIDCAKIEKKNNDSGEIFVKYPSVEIFSSSKIHSVPNRTQADKNNGGFYENCIKPVNIAYEQKAIDYSVELGILENAKKMAEVDLKKLVNAEISLTVDDYKKSYEVKYLPFVLEVAEDYFGEKGMNVIPIKDDKFYRDSFIIESAGNENWKIRIGDSGRTFKGTFSEFYSNVRDTNIDSDNYGRDKVEIFRYFDPMFPKESEILGYASDYFRTMFLLQDGRVYYVDAECESEQTLIDSIAPTMIYIAASLRKIKNQKIKHFEEYKAYIDNFFAAQENIRNNDSRIELLNNVNRLVKSNVLQKEKENTQEEKYLLAAADLKAMGRTEGNVSVAETSDEDFDSIASLVKDLFVSSSKFATNEGREKALDIVANLDAKIYRETNKKGANTQYLLAYFLQNAIKFNLNNEDKKKYEEDIRSGETLIVSRPIIARIGDSERNEYFYNIFKNHLETSHFFVDTAEAIDEKLKKSVRGTNMFVYYNLPEFGEFSDGDIYNQIKKQNNEKDLNNAFIFVFNQIDWDFGNLGKDNDIHAIVLDEATLRFFPNVGSVHVVERVADEVGNMISGMRTKNNEPEFFYYGDWKKLRVTPENVTINGHSFATHKTTKKGKGEYRNTNDYAEKSVIASVIDDLQHAYSNEDSFYFYRVLVDNLDYQIQRYVYKKIFRPSPRLKLDMREDAKHRYNA